MKLCALLPSGDTLSKLSPVCRKQWDDFSFLSEGWLSVSQVFPAPLLFCPRKPSSHSSPTVWCHGRPHLSLPGHHPFSLSTLLSCADYLPSVSQAKSFSHTQMRFCPFSTQVSLFLGSLPLFCQGWMGGSHRQPLCAHNPVHTSTTRPWHQDIVMTHSSDVCVGAPDWNVIRFMWGLRVLVSLYPLRLEQEGQCLVS